MEEMNKNQVTIGLIIVAVIALAIFVFAYSSSPEDSDGEALEETTMKIDYPEINSDNPLVTMKTSMGNITLEIYMDRMPITAGNFMKLVRNDFYDGTKFHRVIENFMNQGGDPNSKGDDVTTYGRGGPGYTIADEFHEELSNLRGTLAMANVGGVADSGGSQFFINVRDNERLDFNKFPPTAKHPVFGHVVSGMDVVDAINLVKTTGEDMGNIPLEPVVIEDIEVIREHIDLREDVEEEVTPAPVPVPQPEPEPVMEEEQEDQIPVADIAEETAEEATEETDLEAEGEATEDGEEVVEDEGFENPEEGSFPEGEPIPN